MTEQESVKVYELAKELGIDSISLLDKLKGLNINVKNHMSDLQDADVETARSAFRKPLPGAKTAAKTAKKPAAATAAARTRKKESPPQAAAPRASASATSAAKEASAGDKKATSPVLRRRTKSDGATEIVSSKTAPLLRKRTASVSEEQRAEEAEGAEANAAQLDGAEAMEAETAIAQEAMGDEEQDATSLEQAASEVSEATAEELSEPLEAAGETASEVTTETTETAASLSPTSQTQAPIKTRAPVVLTPRPVAPRRSILKIVEAAPPPARPVIKPAAPADKAASGIKPGVKGTTTQDKDGFRIIKMTKENLDQMVEEEAARKRLGVGRESEIRPEDVRFADYRKKEMVFLPKKKKIPVGKEIRKTQLTVSGSKKRVVEMQDNIAVSDLANQLSLKATDVIRKLMGMGQMVTINQAIDFDTATLVAAEFQYEVKNVAFKEDTLIEATQDAEEKLLPRPPIVTIMGHVDHGKTTLLDSIREARVAAGEAGGITQHIGAYTVEKNGKLITFIDTPGHEAFSVMRARGANVTDIVILVVSADDGVMPQTREALSHAQAAKVPVIVAINKIDKPGANPEKIKQGLAELNLLSEDWGGETMFIQVSALKKTNIDKLLDAVLLQAEMLDLKANANARAHGTVIESRLEKGRGPIVSVLVARGTLKPGDAVVAGPFAGRVKALRDDKGRSVDSATPGIAVEILGFEGVPNAGERFDSPATEGDARVIAENRIEKTRAQNVSTPMNKMRLEDLFSRIQAGEAKELDVILKADAFGSVEAIRDSLVRLGTDKVKVKVIHSAAGGITESDVMLASASDAIIIGFNVRPETKARQLAEAEHIEIKSYSIIYELIDDVKKSMEGLLDKRKVEKFLGRAEVRQIFSIPKLGVIAGTAVIDGKIIRGASLRLLRDSRVIFEGKMSSLRRFKDDAKEVASGYECGIGIENYNDLKPGDVIEAFQIDLIAPTLDEK